MDWLRYLCLAQGVYFFLTAIWPLAHMQSFLAVTGPKHDLWLVRTVAVLILAMSVSFLTAGVLGPPRFEIVLLGISSTLGLAIVDIHYVMRGIISRIYLVDGMLELILATAWAVGWIFTE